MVESQKGDAEKSKAKNNEGSKTTKVEPKPETTPGRWLLVLSQMSPQTRKRTDIPLVLLDVSKSDDGAYDAQLVDSMEFGAVDELVIQSAEITKNSAHIVFGLGRGKLDFQGEIFHKSRGNIFAQGGRCDPVLVIKTDKAKLSNPRAPSTGRPVGPVHRQRASTSTSPGEDDALDAAAGWNDTRVRQQDSGEGKSWREF